jgi:queuine/archaeosine tRNA-ribosyltransferase
VTIRLYFDEDSMPRALVNALRARGIDVLTAFEAQRVERSDEDHLNFAMAQGREPSKNEWNTLVACQCLACRQFGIDGLQATGIGGFSNRATHNLWMLLDEARQIKAHLTDGSYRTWYKDHLDNSIYLPLIEQTLSQTMQSSL